MLVNEGCAGIHMAFDLFGYTTVGVVFRRTFFRDDIGEAKEGRAEGSSMLSFNNNALWINMDFHWGVVFRDIFCRDDIGEAKEGRARAEGSSMLVNDDNEG
jgi:hypothetical protein